MSISIRQLRDGFAGQVTGVDCRDVLSPEIVAAIHARMNEYAVLVFGAQELSDEIESLHRRRLAPRARLQRRRSPSISSSVRGQSSRNRRDRTRSARRFPPVWQRAQ